MQGNARRSVNINIFAKFVCISVKALISSRGVIKFRASWRGGEGLLERGEVL